MKTSLLSAFAALAVASAFFAPAATATDTLQFVNYPYGLNDGSFYVGNASGLLDGAPVTMWCVDFLDEISLGQSWNVNILPLNNPTALNGILGMSGVDFQADYLLALQFNNTTQNDIDVQHAIWNFSDPTNPFLALTPTQQALQNAALAQVGTYDFSNAYIMMPDPIGSGQAFEMAVMTQVPEPSTPWLVALGVPALCGAALLRKRKKSLA